MLVQFKTMQEKGELENWILKKGITWKSQPPNAPHFGGAHESPVRSTKLALYRALDIEKKGLRLPRKKC